MNDEKIRLIKDAINGSKTSLEQIIKQEQDSIYATLLYLKRNEQELPDILQDVLVKMSKKISQLKEPTKFKIWLNQIIINSYYDYLRKNKRFENNVELDYGTLSNKQAQNYKFNPQEKILSSELDRIIKSSIQNLPSRYKIPIALREIQGLSYDDISSLTNSTIGTVKSRIARARVMIKEDLSRYLQ